MRKARQAHQDGLHVLRGRLQLRNVDQRPAHPQSRAGPGPANGISTCVKGKFAWDYINSEERLTKPLMRDGDTFREATLGRGARNRREKLGENKRDHGPDAMEFISSSKCTNEESYLMQKLARAVVGTNNIDNCSRYCQTPATMGLCERSDTAATRVRFRISRGPAWWSSSAATRRKATPCSPHA